MELEAAVTRLWNDEATDEPPAAILEEFLDALESGAVRAATPTEDGWQVNRWVKQGILLVFQLRDRQPYTYGGQSYYDVLPLQDPATFGDRGTRNTPDGTTVRRGAYIGADTILMSPSFVNIGATVGAGTLVDSNTTVGSCAQLGTNVKLGANSLIGGVLEPVEDRPVIVEDDVTIGAGSILTSGVQVGAETVIGERTLVTPRIPIYDLVADTVRYGEIPAQRRVFQRYVESSVSEHELLPGAAYKPALVATALETTTLEATQREDALR